MDLNTSIHYQRDANRDALMRKSCTVGEQVESICYFFNVNLFTAVLCQEFTDKIGCWYTCHINIPIIWHRDIISRSALS